MLPSGDIYIINIYFKGFGVVATRDYQKGDFLLEYVGEQITQEEGERRQRKYAGNKMFFFSFKGKKLWYVKKTQTQ